jgi:hypothetical protein
MTGALQMNSYKIEGLANGMMSTEAVNKGQLDSGVQEAKDYTDNLEDRALLLNGSQSMTGALQMNSYKIEGLANGMMSTEAVNKGQLDSVEQGLQSQITTEKDRVDAILLASDADKDSFAEIVTLINSVDTSNSDSLAGHLTATVDAHDASAISVVPAGNLAAVQVQGALEELQVHIDTVEQSVTNLDAYAQEVRSDLDQEIIDRAADVDAEEARATAAEGELQSSIDIEEFNRIVADNALQSAIDAEVTARATEDLTFFKADGSRPVTGNIEMGGNSLNQSINWAFDNEGTSGSMDILPGRFDFTVGDSTYLQNFHVGAGGDGLISKNITVYEQVDPDTGEILVAGSFSNIILETNGLVAHQTFTIRSTEDLDLAGTSISLINENDEIFVPSQPEHAATKAYVDSQISANKDFSKETFEIDVTSELSYIELAQAPVANSLVVFVNRLAVHEGEDYTVSVVDGVTRLTWAGEFAVGGIEEIELGDFIRVTYMY